MKKFVSYLLAIIFLMSISPLTLAKTRGTISKIDINSADVTPIVLDDPYDHIEYELDDEIDYWDNDCYWIKMLGSNYGTTDFDYFDDTSSYLLFWEFECDSDYTFSSSPTIKINGSTSDVDKNLSYRDPDDPTVYYVYTTARKATDLTPAEIKFISITDIDTRIAGGDKALQHTKYTLPSNPRYSMQSAEWIDENGDALDKNDFFEAGCDYYFSMTLKGNSPCTFYDDPIVTLNGSEELIGSYYVDYDDPTLLHIETVSVTALNRDELAKVFLLIDANAGETGLAPGLYNIDIHTCDMAYISPLTFQFFCLEEIDGYYYGYDRYGAFHIIDAETNKVEHNYNNPGIHIIDLAYNIKDDCLYGIDYDEKGLYKIDLSNGKGELVHTFSFKPVTLAYADGCFYIGSYGNGKIFKYDPKTDNVDEFTNLQGLKRKNYAQTMAYSYEDDCLWTYVCQEENEYLVRIEMDGSYSIEREYGIVQYVGLMFRRPELETYTVTFVDGLTDEVIEEKQVKEGHDVVFPQAPFHAGYSFTGWDSDGTDIQSDTTITAQYDVKKFIVTFVDGLTDEVIDECEVDYGEDVTFPEPPDHTDEGYYFTEWDSDGKNIKSDMQITAQYSKTQPTPPPTTEPTSPIEATVGDLNGDGKINTADAVVVLKISAGMIALDEKYQAAGDCNGDGKVNTADAVLILKYAAGMITNF